MLASDCSVGKRLLIYATASKSGWSKASVEGITYSHQKSITSQTKTVLKQATAQNGLPSHPHLPGQTRTLIHSPAQPTAFSYHQPKCSLMYSLEKQHNLFENIVEMCSLKCSKSCYSCVKKRWQLGLCSRPQWKTHVAYTCSLWTGSTQRMG